MAVTTVLNPAAVAEMLAGPGGLVARHTAKLGAAIKATTITSLKRGFPHDFLAPGLKVTPLPAAAVRVGSDHTRTVPHPIHGRPTLTFGWADPPGEVGPPGVYSFAWVNHPGSDLGPYLQSRLERAVTSVGLSVGISSRFGLAGLAAGGRRLTQPHSHLGQFARRRP